MCMYSQPSSKEARAAEREMERLMREENKRERMLAKQARLCAQYEALPLYDDFKRWAAGLFDVIAYLARFDDGHKKVYRAFCECGKSFEPSVRKSGVYVTCPHCGRQVRLRDVRRSSYWSDHKVVALLQRCEVGYMQRIFLVYKTTRFHEDCSAEIKIDFGEEQRDVIGADGFQHRKYFSYHQKRWSDEYVAGAGYLHGSGWCAWRAEDMPMDTYPGNIDDVLRGGKFQYSQLAAAAGHNKVNPFDYLRQYEQYPQVEMLYKAGLYKFALEFANKEVKNGHRRWADFTSPRDYGLVTKEDFVEAAAKNYGIAELLARKRIRGWEFSGDAEREEAIEFMLALNDNSDIDFEYQFISNRSLFRYWRSQAAEFMRESSIARANREKGIRYFLRDYSDYISDCINLQYDLHDTSVSQPKHFAAAHDRVTKIMVQLRREMREKELSAVHAVYERLHSLIEWTDGKMLVRMAKDNADLVREGKEMHHCVGGYGDRVGRGDCIIFFIRRAAEPDKVFYTVEIRPDLSCLHIVQCRGFRNNDRSPEERAEVDAFLKKYERWFNTRAVGDRPLQAAV